VTRLEVRGLGKAYRRYRSELRRVLTWFGVPGAPAEETWALRGVGFSVEAGEAVGVIGQNGAGKSTLLKLIAGTQRPTEGEVLRHGRIAAILELGMGFDAEATGLWNSRHALRLMGFGREESDRVIPEVREFAEIGDYFEHPVRTYSSGMQMRVAFAVATAVRPEILIVDEALAVGDAYFQHKSLGRILEFRRAGTSLLLVSHDREAILAVCNRAILLESGRLTKAGSAHEVTDYYNARIAEREASTVRQTPLGGGRVRTISGTGEAIVESIALLDARGSRIEVVGVGESVVLQVDARLHADLDRLVLGYMIRDRLGQTMYGTNTHHTRQVEERLRRGDRVRYRIAFPANLGPGTYSISTALTDASSHLSSNYEWQDFALVFTVESRGHVHFAGSAWIEPRIEIERGEGEAGGSL
jgi:lipopolysaccharide transport system ATP-binding protein